MLCDFEGLTHDRAAASLHWPVGTVRGYLARARDLLRSRLVRRGVAPALATSVLDSGLSSAAMLTPPLIEAVTATISKGSVTTTVAALTGSIARGLLASRMRRVVLALLVVSLGIGGVVLATFSLRKSAPPEDPPIPAVGAAARPTPKPADSDRLDAEGNPLPAAAVARLGTLRLNHGAPVDHVAFAPDGKLLASAGNGEIRLWDPRTGREVRQLGQPRDLLMSMAFSPDGKVMAAGQSLVNEGERIILFDVESGRELSRSDRFEGRVWSMAFSPDGRTIAVGSYIDDNDGGSGEVILWDSRFNEGAPANPGPSSEHPCDCVRGRRTDARHRGR